MATAQPTYHRKTVEVLDAGNRRFLIKSGNGAGHNYAMERALGKLVRRVGAVIERTGYGSVVYLQFPPLSRSTGKSCDLITTQVLADFIANQ